MAYTTPFEIVQGTKYEWTLTNSDYPATDNFTASLTLISTEGTLTVAGVVDGADWDFTLTPAQTSALYAGVYRFSVVLTDGTDTYTVESGLVHVLPDATIAQPVVPSGKSFARQRYENYCSIMANEAMVKAMQPGQISEMEEAIRRLEWDLKREDDAEKAKRGENTTRKLYVRFV